MPQPVTVAFARCAGSGRCGRQVYPSKGKKRSTEIRAGKAPTRMVRPWGCRSSLAPSLLFCPEVLAITASVAPSATSADGASSVFAPAAIPTARGEATDGIRSPKALPRPPPRVFQLCWHGELGQGPLHTAVAFGIPMSRLSLANLAFGCCSLGILALSLVEKTSAGRSHLTNIAASKAGGCARFTGCLRPYSSLYVRAGRAIRTWDSFLCSSPAAVSCARHVNVSVLS